MRKLTRFQILAVSLVALVFDFQHPAIAKEPSTVQPEIVHFFSGNLLLGGELYKPKGKGPFPAVLYNHGSAENYLSDAASSAMGPLYVAKGWIYFMPYRRGQGWSSDAGPYIGDEIDAASEQGGQKAASQKMIELQFYMAWQFHLV